MSPTQLRVLVLVLGLYVVDGFDMQILGVTVFALADDWRLPIAAFGAAMAAGHAGSAFGAAIGGVLGDRFGRKPVAVAGTFLFGALTIATVLATTPAMVVALRFAAGLGLGGCLPPALALLTESLPARRSGAAVSFALVCPPLGVTLAGLLAGALLPTLGWQGVFVIGGAVPLLAAVVLLLLLPESPAYRAAAGGPDRRARAASSREVSLTVLVSGPRSRESLGLFATFFAAYFAMSMVMSWLPALLAQRGFAALVAGTALSAWSLAGIGGSILAGLLIARWGSRTIARLYMAAATLALCAVALLLPAGGGAALLYGLMMLGGCLLSGSIASIYAYGGTLFEPAVRASGIGIAATTGRIGAIVGAWSGAAVLAGSGARGYFLLVAAVIAVALAAFSAGAAARAPAATDADTATDAARPPPDPSATE